MKPMRDVCGLILNGGQKIRFKFRDITGARRTYVFKSVEEQARFIREYCE